MMTQFKPLLSLALTHAYYSGACPDFDFIVAPATQQVLANGKLVAKIVNGTLIILYEGGMDGSPVRRLDAQTLRIGLRLNNINFLNFTALNLTNDMPLYRNAAAPAVLDVPLAVRVVGARFTHTLEKTDRPVTVNLKPNTEAIVKTDIVMSANDTATVSYLLGDVDCGLYTVEELYAGDTRTTAYYYDNASLGACFAVVELALNDAFYNTPPAFSIPFDARRETLKYYVVAKNYSDGDAAQLSVADTGFGSDGRAQIQFDKIPASGFGSGDIAPALLAGSDAKVLLFKSQAAVLRSAKAKTRIALNKNGEILIPQLPQPGAGSSTADLIVQVTKQ